MNSQEPSARANVGRGASARLARPLSRLNLRQARVFFHAASNSISRSDGEIMKFCNVQGICRLSGQLQQFQGVVAFDATADIWWELQRIELLLDEVHPKFWRGDRVIAAKDD